jgi:hypothetical protein
MDKRWARLAKLWAVGSGIWLVYALSGVIWTLVTDEYARGALLDPESLFSVLLATSVDIFGPPFLALVALSLILLSMHLARILFIGVTSMVKKGLWVESLGAAKHRR